MRPLVFPFLLISLIIGSHCNAQSKVPILLDSSLVQGIYMSFEEFKQNNPSIKVKVTAVTKKTAGLFDDEGTEFMLGTVDNKKDFNVNKVWGFSDGESVFIRKGYNLIKSGHVYNKIESFGRYCFYLGSTRTSGAPIVNEATGTVTSTSRKEIAEYIIDLNTGKAEVIKQRMAEKILEKDPEILALYIKDKSNSIGHYLWLYSQKHADEIR